MNSNTDNLTDFLSSASNLDGMSLPLAQALINMNGSQCFLDNVILLSNTNTINRVDKFQEITKSLEIYAENKKLFFYYLSSRAKVKGYQSGLHFAESIMTTPFPCSQELVAEVMSNPAPKSNDNIMDTTPRYKECSQALLHAICQYSIVQLAKNYRDFISDDDDGTKIGLEVFSHGSNMEFSVRLSYSLVEKLGGYIELIETHRDLVSIDTQSNPLGFKSDTEMVDFFEVNKKEILDAVRVVAEKKNSDRHSHPNPNNTAVFNIHEVVEDLGYSINDVGHSVFAKTSMYSSPKTNKSDIARAAINMSVMAMANDYADYTSKKKA